MHRNTSDRLGRLSITWPKPASRAVCAIRGWVAIAAERCSCDGIGEPGLQQLFHATRCC